MASLSVKRSFSELQYTMKCPKEILNDDDGPVKKKSKKNLIDIFNRASMCLNASEDHMNVFLRIKPFTAEDSLEENQGCLTVNEAEQSVITSAPELSNAHKNLKRGLGKSEHKFTFSRIFNENTSQGDFFNETMLGMTKDFISGQNSLVFTYGVTSSGKTFTIQGQPQDAGILPRSLDVLFNSINGKQSEGIRFKPLRFTDVVRLCPEEESAEKRIRDKTLKLCLDEDFTVSTLLGDETDAALSCTMASCSSTSQDELLPDIESRIREDLKVDVDDNGKFNFSVWISFAEIYNEQIFDLLEKVPQKKSCRRTALKISDDQNGSPYIKGLKEIHVDSADDAYRLLTIGKRNLQTASTRLNHCSSRSHCIFTIKVIRVVDKDDPNIARVSMLSFCDLAGSERNSKTQATGDRLKEAGNINTSLMTLGRCIEILRFNQMHRESQKIVPFRDSKLTRLFQNFFNGSGRAAMIVNVSQCASMFDETLHVFKFSAIAKQVKYLQKPVEAPKPKKKKILPPLPRPSIAWEETGSSKVLLEDASNEPLPTDNDDSEEDSNLEEDSVDMDYIISKKSPEELKQTIKLLMGKNALLCESLEEEMINSSNIEMRVRREVCETMKRQQVLIEKEYSKLLEESEEDAKETMDERVQNVIAIYEKKLERVQRKVDEDDEWVSSLLFFQEQKKVKERDARIADLEKLLEEKENHKCDSSKDTDKDEKIEHLEECILELRSLHYSNEKEKEEKIKELESYIQEAGDTYEGNTAQIEKLRQAAVAFALETKARDESLRKVEAENVNLKELYDQSVKKIDELEKESESKIKEAEDNKIAELQRQLKDVEKKVTSKDNTIKTLEDECQQMQGEIERLQEEMSQMDDVSKRSDLEASIPDEDTSESTGCDIAVQTELFQLEEVEALTEQNRELQNMKDALHSEKVDLEEKLKMLTEDNSVLRERVNCVEEQVSEITHLREMNEHFEAEIIAYQQEAKKNAVVKEHCPTTPTSGPSTMITDMVRDLETKSTPCNKSENSQDSMAYDDEEIVFKHALPKPGSQSENFTSVNVSASQLKDAEITINALRNKLRREEEDFFKREQALIHGYTAEIDNLKLDLMKLKNKSESSKAKSEASQQSEKLKNMSLMSNSPVEEVERSLTLGVKDQNEHSPGGKGCVAVLTSELASCQEELISCREAYHQLQSQGKNNETHSFPQGVALGHAGTGKRQSTQGVICLEDNMTDSVLQFEMTEYAVKLDMWKNKVEELRHEVESKEKLLLEAKGCRKEIQERLDTVMIEKNALQSEMGEDKSKIACFELELKELNERIEEHQSVIGKKDSAFEEVNAEMRDTIVELREKIESMEEEVSDKDEIIQQRNLELNDMHASNSDLKMKLKSQEELVTSLRKETEEMQLQLTEQEEKSKSKDSKLLNDAKQELQHVLYENSKLEKESQQLGQDVKELKNKLDLSNVEKEKHDKDAMSKSQELQELVSQLDKEKEANSQIRNTLEKIKQDHQQESAEVSQKLILLEKEKRIAERKFIEMKDKEQEWQMKYQGQEKMKELEHQLQNQLRTTTEALKKHSSKTIELSEELDNQQTEINLLKEERDQSKCEFENLQLHTTRMEEECTSLRQKAEEAQKRAKELITNVIDMKTGLQDSDETTERQEKIITAQDEQISNLKSKIDALSLEKDQLVKVMLEKEQEIKDLNVKHEKKAEDLQEEIEKVKSDSQVKREKLTTIKNDLEMVNTNMQDEVKKRNQLEKEIELLKTKRDTDLSNTSVQHEDTKNENLKLREENSKYADDLKEKAQIVENLQLQINRLKENLNQHEKNLAKQENINRRNKEEMDIWKKERDQCVGNFEEVLKRVVQEKKDLTHENEKLKKDNADLAKQVTNSRCAKDKVIEDLKKNNNTLSIELASVQGISPPPKMDTPDGGFPNRIDFVEDNDTTGHLEMDATPPAALKKGRKRHHGSSRNTSYLDNCTPTRESLKTIEETNEYSPTCSSPMMKNPPSGVTSDLAKDIFSSLSPLTRSGQNHSRGKQQKRLPPPSTFFNTSEVHDENLPARRSSRLKSKCPNKHSMV